MSRTFHQLTGNGSDFTTSDPYIASSPVGYQDFEWARQALDLLAYVGDAIPLGGIRSVGFVTGAATWEAVDVSFTHVLDGDQLGGMTLDLVVTTWTEDASQAVQARLRNTTDSSNAAVSTSHSSTSQTTETVSVTLASGAKSYRLEVLGGADFAVFAIAFLRVRKVPA